MVHLTVEVFSLLVLSSASNTEAGITSGKRTTSHGSINTSVSLPEATAVLCTPALRTIVPTELPICVNCHQICYTTLVMRQMRWATLRWPCCLGVCAASRRQANVVHRTLKLIRPTIISERTEKTTSQQYHM